MALEQSELELIKNGFAGVNRRLDEQKEDSEVHRKEQRETNTVIFRKLDDQQAEIVEATRVATGANICAVTARDTVENHVECHKKKAGLWLKWALGIFGAIVTTGLFATCNISPPCLFEG